jgi:hypothetical protein
MTKSHGAIVCAMDVFSTIGSAYQFYFSFIARGIDVPGIVPDVGLYFRILHNGTVAIDASNVGIYRVIEKNYSFISRVGRWRDVTAEERTETFNVLDDACDIINASGWLSIEGPRLCPGCGNLIRINDVSCFDCENKSKEPMEKHIGRSFNSVRHEMAKKRDRYFLAIGLRDGFYCKNCGSIDDICIDHILPVSRGGGNDESNLQLLCRSCNSKKGVS